MPSSCSGNRHTTSIKRRRASGSHGAKWNSDKRSSSCLSVGYAQARSRSCWRPWIQLHRNTCQWRHQQDDAANAERTVKAARWRPHAKPAVTASASTVLRSITGDRILNGCRILSLNSIFFAVVIVVSCKMYLVFIVMFVIKYLVSGLFSYCRLLKAL